MKLRNRGRLIACSKGKQCSKAYKEQAQLRLRRIEDITKGKLKRELM